jgi:hypothetical protein
VRTFTCEACRIILNVPYRAASFASTIKLVVHRLEEQVACHYRNSMVTSGSTTFRCQQCTAEYVLVRMEAPMRAHEKTVTCLRCGAPLQGRRGTFVLKYFLLNRPSLRQRRIQ